jgi:glutamine synthetase
MSQRSADEIIQDLEDRGTRRVKLGIFDIDGVLRGKYVSMEKFRSCAQHDLGFCDCIFDWDTSDQLYDNASFTGWHTGFPDATLRIDLSTQRMLSDEPNTPLFLCELVPPNGEGFHPICPRNLLRRVVDRAEKMGFAARAAFEYEFFIFQETPHSIREKGFKDLTPLTPGMFGYSVLRNSVYQELYHGLMDQCIEMDMALEGLHTETGPGVWEAAIAHDAILQATDKAALFKTFTKVFFQRHDLMATFMAKWSPLYPGQSGHLHQSLWDASSDQALFHDPAGRGRMTELMEHFVAGQVQLMREFCPMVGPTVNSYRRMVKGAWAPTAATWGIDNRTCALRVIPGSEKSQRCEYRLAAADGNPYLVAAAALASGLFGIEHKLKLSDPVVGNAYDAQEDLLPDRRLCSNLRDANRLFGQSKAARELFGDDFVDHFAASRDWEVQEFEKAITDWELQRYFEII